MNLGELLLKPIIHFISDTIQQIQKINKKYAVPHIKASKSVTFSLILLRLYLIFLVGILFYKFFMTIAQK
jgi:hypothetical protein